MPLSPGQNPCTTIMNGYSIRGSLWLSWLGLTSCGPFGPTNELGHGPLPFQKAVFSVCCATGVELPSYGWRKRASNSCLVTLTWRELYAFGCTQLEWSLPKAPEGEEWVVAQMLQTYFYVFLNKCFLIP